MNDIKDIYVGMYLAAIGMIVDFIRILYILMTGGGVLVSMIIFLSLCFVFNALLKKKKMKEIKIG